jgi:hypothetical protein
MGLAWCCSCWCECTICVCVDTVIALGIQQAQCMIWAGRIPCSLVDLGRWAYDCACVTRECLTAGTKCCSLLQIWLCNANQQYNLSETAPASGWNSSRPKTSIAAYLGLIAVQQRCQPCSVRLYCLTSNAGSTPKSYQTACQYMYCTAASQ